MGTHTWGNTHTLYHHEHESSRNCRRYGMRHGVRRGHLHLGNRRRHRHHLRPLLGRRHRHSDRRYRGALALTGGLVLLKGLALAAIVASRSRRAAVAVDETDSAFSVLAAQEPAQCYRRLICDLATGSLEKSENDVIVSLFNKD